MRMKLISVFLVLAVLFTVSLAFQPRLHACRQVTRLHSDESGKGFGKKKATVKETPTKQPFNARLNPESVTPDSTAIVRSKDENLYQTPRARREAELDEKIARLKEEEDLISGDTSVGAVPELIADRMIGRIVAFFGVPVFGGTQDFMLNPHILQRKMFQKRN